MLLSSTFNVFVESMDSRFLFITNANETIFFMTNKISFQDKQKAVLEIK